MDGETPGSGPLPPAPGRLLVAAPSLADPNFARAVVLLLDADPGGCLGVVLNRPSEVEVGSVLADWAGIGPGPDVLFRGGPVEPDCALGVARVAEDVTGAEPMGWRRVAGSTGLVDLDTPVAVVADALGALRIFAGYAGWSPGQLEEEIAEGAWYVVDGEPGDAFLASPEDLWTRVLRRQGGRMAMLATLPADPRMN